MSRKSLTPIVLAAALSCLTGSLARADFAFTAWSEDRDWYMVLDESHDLVLIELDGNRVEVRILMFDPAEFPAVPSLDEYSTDELEDMAADKYEFNRSLDLVWYLQILCLGGNDVVLTDPDFPVPLYLDGCDGDDHLEGGAAGDKLIGGDDVDHLFGRGGADLLTGDFYVGDWFSLSDGVRDYLQGDGGPDGFRHHYKVVTVQGRYWWSLPRSVRVYEDKIIDLTAEDWIAPNELD